jgi:hypothetical protein
MSTRRTDGKYDGIQLFSSGYIADNSTVGSLGHIAVRKFGVDADGTYRSSSVKQIAWLDDINAAIASYTDAQDAQQASITWNSVTGTITELSLNDVIYSSPQTYTWTKSGGWDSTPSSGTSIASYVSGKYIVLNGNVMILNVKIVFPGANTSNYWTYNSSISVKFGDINYSMTTTSKLVTYSMNTNIQSRFMATLANKELTITQTGQDLEFENTELYFSFTVPVS